MSEFLDRAGLAYYDGKLKGYVTTEMNEALEEALSEFSSALIFQDFIVTNTTMHDTYANAKKGYVYIVNAANVNITYYNSQGTLVSEPAEIGDTVICLKEKEGTTADKQSRWGILQVNWNVQNTGNVLQFGSAVTIAVVGGKNITVELPELRLGIGTSYVEIPSGSGYVEIPSVMFDSTNGFTVTIGSTTVSIASIAALQQALGITAVVADVNYDTTNKKFTKTKNGTTTDIVTATQLKTDMQLNNVGNFKAVSTVANQGLTSTEKTNARANIGLDVAIRVVESIAESINLDNSQHIPYEAIKVDDLPDAISVTYTKENGDTATVSPHVGDLFVCVSTGVPPKWVWIPEGEHLIDLMTSLNTKADKSTTVTGVAYDTANKKITKTINGTTSDVVTAAKLKTDMGLDNVGNFKAVSTVANQGLTATEKSNARTNIGLDTAIRIVGTIDDTINLNTAQNALYEALKVDDLPSAIQVTYTRENGDEETVSPEVGDIFVCVRPYDSTGGSYANWTWITEGRDTAIPNSWIDTLFPDDNEA